MPKFLKGQSGNPSGVAKAKSAPGYDGVQAYGGYVDLGEGDPHLQGAERWKTAANLYRRPPVAIWGRLRSALFAGVKWTAVENEAGGKDAERGREIVEQGLLGARLGTGATMKPWSAVAARSINAAAALGFSVHATATARRKDGMVVFTDIASRPAHTIEKFFRERDNDETTPFVAVEQRTAMGRPVRIDLDEALYLVNDNGTNSDSPMGVGMLFLIAERARRLGVYEAIEGTEVASSLGGVPITRAPLSEMSAAAGSKLKNDANAATKIAAVITEKLRPFREFVARRFKDPGRGLAWFELDSATYQGSNPNSISTIQKWGLEIVKGQLQGLSEVRKINLDLDLDLARMLGIEHVWMGGGDTTGTYGAHESKLTAMGAAVNAEVGLFAFVAEQQLARRIVAKNGLDPDTACPTLVPSPVMRADVARAVDAVVKIGMAGLKRNHPAKKAVFEAVDLPWEDEDEGLLPPRPPIGSLPPARGEQAKKPVELVDPAANGEEQPE